MEDFVRQSQRNAFRFGMSPSEFWSLTPYELTVFIEERAEARQAEYREAMSIAWHTALFQRSKKLPDLRALMYKLGAPRQSQEEIRNIFRSAAAAGVGKLSEGN